MSVGKGLVLLLWATALNSWAAEFEFDALAFGYGQSCVSKGPQFHLAEASANWNLCKGWDLGEHWNLRPRLGLSAGWLTCAHDYGFIGRLGPNLKLAQENFPFSFFAGLSPVYLAQTRYGDRDFSIPVQFATQAGFEYAPTERWALGYRFEHMSNAGLGEHNAGLNLHIFSIALRF